jgi:hypothetical protein
VREHDFDVLAINEHRRIALSQSVGTSVAAVAARQCQLQVSAM